jgi:hypothetical protein
MKSYAHLHVACWLYTSKRSSAGGCAKIYDDMFAVVGSRKVVTPGLA